MSPAGDRSQAQTVRVGGRDVRLTHPDRVLWPRDGITKARLVEYYVQVSALMLPHLAGRPLVLTRFPRGIEGPSFYQKQAPFPRPAWVPTARIEHERRSVEYVMADSPAVLAWLGNLAAVEIHPWMSTAADPDHPDLLVIDLDPDPPSGFEESRRVALWLRPALEALGLRAVPKLSGATGVHVCIPLVPRYPYAVTSRAAAAIGRALAGLRPDLVTDRRRVVLRRGRVYVDPYQNLRGRTVVAPYSPRALPGAPVSVPVTWEELEQVVPADFTVANAHRWLPGRRDPLLEARRAPQSLDALLDRGLAPGSP